MSNSPIFSGGDISIDDFNQDAITFLLDELRDEISEMGWRRTSLGALATELFVFRRILPLLNGATGTFRKNLRQVLDEAGRRHGRRYASENNE